MRKPYQLNPRDGPEISLIAFRMKVSKAQNSDSHI
jgi:hypothetical protein